MPDAIWGPQVYFLFPLGRVLNFSFIFHVHQAFCITHYVYNHCWAAVQKVHTMCFCDNVLSSSNEIN